MLDLNDVLEDAINIVQMEYYATHERDSELDYGDFDGVHEKYDDDGEGPIKDEYVLAQWRELRRLVAMSSMEDIIASLQRYHMSWR